MQYIALHIKLSPTNNEFTGILSALLDDKSFEGIYESENGLIAYIPAEKFESSVLITISHTLKAMGCSMEWNKETIPAQNWNRLWESNFDPVVIEDRCVIRAPFHESFNSIPIRITIEPKMSFGTGHHQTTRLMIEQMLEINFTDKKVLDMGCGTGVLGILASLLRADKVYCIDTDSWAYENTLENISKNLIDNITVIQGGKEAIPAEKFDILLANINRNIITDQLDIYGKVINNDGLLIISGFLEEDQAAIKLHAESSGFTKMSAKLLDNWMLMLCKRI
jgi:ribosomal protein L11 methyltransferase